jgi:hypothetical protein
MTDDSATAGPNPEREEGRAESRRPPENDAAVAEGATGMAPPPSPRVRRVKTLIAFAFIAASAIFLIYFIIAGTAGGDGTAG